MIYDYLVENLNPRSGIILPNVYKTEPRSGCIFSMRFPENVTLEVHNTNSAFWCYVSKGVDYVTCKYIPAKVDGELIQTLQTIIDDVDQKKLKYRDKYQEKCERIVQERRLTLVIDEVKWRTLFKELNAIPTMVLYARVTLLTGQEKSDSDFFSDIYDVERYVRESRDTPMYYAIEQMEIKTRKYQWQGGYYGLHIHAIAKVRDNSGELVKAILDQHNIAYEVKIDEDDEDEELIIFKGYV